MPSKSVFAGLLAVALLAAGCGNSAKPSPNASTTSNLPTSSSPTTMPADPHAHAEFIAKANAICATLVKRVAPIHDTNFATVSPRIAHLELLALKAWHTLTPPSELASDWQDIVKSQQQITADTIKLGELSASHSSQAVMLRVFTAANELQQQMFTFARHAGLHECSHIA